MRKKHTKTAGKTATICAYRRSQLAKFGIKDYHNMARVLNPKDYPFSFNEEGFSITIEPAKEILPDEAYKKLMTYVRGATIKKGMCHIVAYEVSHLLEGYGVLFCDGYYSRQGGKLYTHSFCKYDNRYFDPTVEFGLGFSPGITFTYYSSRTFEPKEILIYYVAASLIRDNRLVGFDNIATPTTLEYCFGEPFYAIESPKRFLIDDDGYMQWIDNPTYIS